MDQALLGALLGLLAHDLRNPLSALQSNLGFLTSVLPASDIDAREAVQDGFLSCDGLAHIIDNIELLGRSLREASPRDRTGTFSLAELASEAVEVVRAMASSHGVVVRLEPPGAGPWSVTGGRDFLKRALVNLLRNAIQHSPSGGAVRVSVSSSAGEVCVLVEDHGNPLPRELRGAAFTAEGQVGAKSVPNGRYSRGLGLFCAGLAAAGGGASARVVDPPSGGGNAFQLGVPRAP